MNYVDTLQLLCFFFFFNDTATTEIYTLSLHDALPIFRCSPFHPPTIFEGIRPRPASACSDTQSASASEQADAGRDRKSTRLNSSHSQISYAVFCLKKKKKNSNTRVASTALTYLTVSRY